jgi:hypothetical protein
MMAEVVPIQPIANQTLQAQLGGQSCVIEVQQLQYGLFFTLFVGNTLIVAPTICQNKNRLVRLAYLGFVGDFTFVDMMGTDDPIYTGLGSRFLLVYLEVSDLPAGEG